jgi:hypothetical protein
VTPFEIAFDLHHELIRRRPIDDSVIKRQTQVRHETDRNSLVDDHGSFLDRADAEDGELGLMNNRRAEQAAESAVVRDCKRAPLDLLGVNFLALARSARSATSSANCISPFPSAFRTTGTRSPSSNAVAIPT